MKPKDINISLIHTYALHSIVLFFIRLGWFSSSFPWWKYQLVYSFWIMLYSITLNKALLTGFSPTVIYLIFEYQRAFLTYATCESFCLWTATIIIIITNRNQLVVVTSWRFTWKFCSSKNIFKTRHNRLEKILPMLNIGQTTNQHLLRIMVCVSFANILKTSKNWGLQQSSSQVSHIWTSKSNRHKLSALTLLLSQNNKECRDHGKIWPRVQNSRCTILGKCNKISVEVWTLKC